MQGMCSPEPITNTGSAFKKRHASNTDGWSLLCSTRSRTGGQVPLMQPSKTLGLTPHIREHRLRAVHFSSEKHRPVLMMVYKITSNLGPVPWTHHLVNSDRKMSLSFLSPELSQAPAFPSAALKGTSSSPSLGRKWWEERQRLRGLAFLCTERDLKLAEVTMTTHLSDNKSQKSPAPAGCNPLCPGRD